MTPPLSELIAPAHWQEVALLSDVHLQASEAATFQAWQTALLGCQADAVFILGDLFEVWVGDDAAQGQTFEAACLALLRSVSAQRPVYLMHGNRDFLLGAQAAAQAGLHLLADPTVLVWGQTRTLLTHGDALCVGDVPYQTFRQQVRSTDWQQRFLAQPLQVRRAQAAAMRQRSEANKQHAGYADIDLPTAQAWLQAARSACLIHGHTHQPSHDQWDGVERWVMSDWDALATPARGELLTLRLSTEPGRLQVQRTKP